jgi:hypothetical protein
MAPNRIHDCSNGARLRIKRGEKPEQPQWIEGMGRREPEGYSAPFSLPYA